jgi:hypothetical protein
MVLRIIKNIAKQLVYCFWVMYGYIGWKLRLKASQKLTVLIASYHPARLRKINHQIRNLLKCEFVEKVVISSHNPAVEIEECVTLTDRRLVLLSQGVRRSGGYRWVVAREFAFEYLIVIDDDIVMFPWQLKILFENLLKDPSVPHGLSGMIQMQNGDLQFHQREDIQVHYLTEIYAVTRKHLDQYFKMVELFVEKSSDLADSIERLADFVVISQTGPKHPRIHRAGRIFRDETYNAQGVATHKDEQFSNVVNQVSRLVKGLRPQLFV